MPTNYTEKDAAAHPPKASAYPIPRESHFGDVRVTSDAFATRHPKITQALTGGDPDSVVGGRTRSRGGVAMPAAPSFHTGGPVMADGVYQLKAGEHVLTAPEAKKARKHALMASGMKSLAKPGKASSKK